MPLKIKAVLLGIISGMGFFYLWALLIGFIGNITDSGPLGICGPYGSFAGPLLIMLIAAPILSTIVGIIIARFYLRKKCAHIIGNTADTQNKD